MEHFKQPKITGYRQLSEQDALLINEIKDLANKTGVMIESLEAAGKEGPYDQRWVAIAKTQLQQGYMALVRAVAKPTGF